MIYGLDTNAIIRIVNEPHSALADYARSHAANDLVISAIVAYELYFGAFKSAKVTRNLLLVEALPFAIVPFEDRDAREAGLIRAELTRIGRPIRPFDTLIAGQARARGWTMVTRNVSEFSRVPGLTIENWED